jgi:hypothetical protein
VAGCVSTRRYLTHCRPRKIALLYVIATEHDCSTRAGTSVKRLTLRGNCFRTSASPCLNSSPRKSAGQAGHAGGGLGHNSKHKKFHHDRNTHRGTDTEVEPASTDDVELPQDLEAAKKLRSEAANLRRRNRELEADNERLITQAAAAQRREIERTAAEVLVDPTDVWRVDPELQQSFYDTEFGEISSDHVIAAAKALIASKPHLARPNTAPPPTQRPIESLRGGASPEPKKKTEVSWSSALRRTGI